jgi:hypothetical protein
MNIFYLKLSILKFKPTLASYSLRGYYNVTCFESRFCEVAFPGQRIWNFIGIRLVKSHIVVKHRLQNKILSAELVQ